MFESYLADILNRSLCKYIENLDFNQLKIRMWKGNIELKDLKLRTTTLNELNLPIQIILGHLGKLILKVPWSNLYSQPVEVTVENLYMLIGPKIQISYDAEKEEAQELEDKRAALKALDEALRKEGEPETTSDPSFQERLIARIVNNIQITVKKVHVRYEDTKTSSAPFALGITLHNLELYTTDKDWINCYMAEITNRVFKLAKLDNFAVYMNCDTDQYTLRTGQELLDMFSANIADKVKDSPLNQYVLGPLSMEAKLSINTAPAQDNPPFTVPKLNLIIQMEKIGLAFNGAQFQDTLMVLESFNSMRLAAPYRKYYPFGLEHEGHWKEWWQYAINSVLEVRVREYNRRFRWEYIRDHRKLCRSYAEAYKETLITPKPPASVIELCNLAETKLDLFNLKLIRQRVFVEVKRYREEMKNRIEEEKKSHWFFVNWFRTPKPNDNDLDIRSRLKAAMTPEEKKKLYAAIGYVENTAPLEMPDHYVAMNLYFRLTVFEISLYKNAVRSSSVSDIVELSNMRNIMLLQLSMLTCNFIQRPGANAISIKCDVEELTLLGYKKRNRNSEPIIIQSDIKTEGNLLDIEYEANPLDTDIDQRLKVHTNSLRLVYDSETLDQLHAQFMPKNQFNLSELEGAATLKIAHFKERSATGMQYLLDKHTKFDVDINCKPNLIIIPFGGDYQTYNDNILVISLGTLAVASQPRQYSEDMVNKLFTMGEDQDKILETVMNSVYDIYNVTMANVQIIVSKDKEDWESVLSQHLDTTLHLLRPTSVIIYLHLCIIDNDPRLPKCKLSVTLPGVNLNITDERILQILRIIYSIQLPMSNLDPEPSRLKHTASTAQLPATQRTTSAAARKKSLYTDAVVQHTKIEASIFLEEFSITLHASKKPEKQSPAKYTEDDDEVKGGGTVTFATSATEESIYVDAATSEEPSLLYDGNVEKLLSIQVMRIDVAAAQRTFENVVNASLGAICVNFYDVSETGENIEQYIIDTPGYKLNQDPLLSVHFKNVDKTTPDFQTKYKSIQTLLEIKFSILHIKLHKENILTVMKFVRLFNNEIQQIIDIPVAEAVRRSSMDSQSSIMKMEHLSIAKVPAIRTTTQNLQIDDELIKLNFIVNIELISLELTCKKRSLAILNIVELDSRIVMKPCYTETKCILKDIKLEDPNPLTKHSSFLSIVGQDAINLNFIFYNIDQSLQFATSEGMKLNLEIGCVKVIYLNWFVVTIMNFMSYFHGAEEAIVVAGSKAADAAKQNVLDTDNVTKILLNVKVKAPVIIVPLNSQSDDAIVIDMGLLTIHNGLLDVWCKKCKEQVSIDEIKLVLKDMRITRAVMLHSNNVGKTVKIQEADEVDFFYGFTSNFNILNRSNFVVNVKRNLSFTSCVHVPLFDLTASLKTIELNLFTDDYNLVMLIMSHNFKEGQSEFSRMTVKSPNKIKAVSSKKHLTEIKESDEYEKKSHRIIGLELYRFNVHFDGFIINLMKTATSGLATFGMYLISVKGKWLDNGTLTVNVILCNAQLEDKRPRIQSVYKTYLCRKDWSLWESKKDSDEHTILEHCNIEKSHMIDFTSVITNNEMILQLRISGFDLIICVDFLEKLAQYFKSYTESKGMEVPFAAVSSEIAQKKALAELSAASSHRRTKISTIGSQMNIQAKVEKIFDVSIAIEEPEILLVENLDDVNTHAIIFNFKSDVNFRSMRNSQVISGRIEGLKMYMCAFHPKHRKNTRHYILHPCMVYISNMKPEEHDLNVYVKFSEIIFNITPTAIELISKAVQSITTTKGIKSTKLSTNTYRKIWEQSEVAEKDHWYIRAEDAVETPCEEALEVIADFPTEDETCIVDISSIIVILESGFGYYTQPLISLETSLNGSINNWSSNITIEATLSLKMDYYNAVLAVWEPVIEPIERTKSDGDTHYEPWTLHYNLHIDTVQTPSDETKTHDITRMTIHSIDELLITISKTFVTLLTKMSAVFSEAMQPGGLSKSFVVAPYVLENDTGFEMNLDLTIGGFTLHDCHTSGKQLSNVNDSIRITLKDPKGDMSANNLLSCTVLLDGKVYLQLKEHVKRSSVEEQDLNLYIKLYNCKKLLVLPLVKADKRYFTVLSEKTNEIMGIVSEVNAEYGTTTINVHSVLNIQNHFNSAIYIYYRKPGVRDLVEVGIAHPNSIFHVPLQVVYNDPRYIFLNVDEYNISVNGIKWDDSPNDMKYTCQVQCEPLRSVEPLLINVQRERKEIFFENTTKYKLHSAYYTLHLKPPIYLRNALPVNITVSVAGTALGMSEELDEILQNDIKRESARMSRMSTKQGFLPPEPGHDERDDNLSEQSNSDPFLQKDSTKILKLMEDLLNYGEKDVESGHTLHLPTMKLSKRKDNTPANYLVVKLLDYLEKDWVCLTEITTSNNELCDWRFTAYDSENPMHMDLYAKCEQQFGCLVVTLFSPFWLVNKTDLMLSYKVDTETVAVLYHPSEYNGPIFFSFRSQHYFDKKSCAIRVDNGEWSKKIPLDVAGSSGFVTCKSKDKTYQIAVHNHITHNSLTKQITFMPYYIMINKCSFTIDVQQHARPADPWKRILEGACMPLWPMDNIDRVLVAKIRGQHTLPFQYAQPMSTLLALEHSEYGGVNVNVHNTEGGVYITFNDYHTGDAPGLIINYTSMPIDIVEKGVKKFKTIPAQRKMLFTWSEPMGDRLLVLDDTNFDLQRDGIGNFKLNNKKIYWVSFLDGLQRILLFTESKSIAKRSESTEVLQIINRSIQITVNGIGVSVVNNQTRTPILYMAIASTGIIWETRRDKNRRFKQINLQDNSEIEILYQTYLLNQETNPTITSVYAVDDKQTVDFGNMTLEKDGKVREMRRTFLPGAWIMMETSPFQMQLHIKVNRLQIDNQLDNYVFPVVLAPIPPPKTLAKTTHFKPFVEMSLIEQIVPNSDVKQYKYASILVQEFHVKIDLNFVMTLVETFANEIDEEYEIKLFKQDVHSITTHLTEVAHTYSQYDQKNFFDNVHLGPVKVHISFSLTGVENTAPPHIISKLLQGVGVTLTSVNDVVLRLGFFERDHIFITNSQLMSEITSHYIGQALKQIYVLVLGLDVLGNPYGLVVGFKQGFEDLFYEPYQGAIQGPGEFVEGLALGVRSLFGHTLGGAANAVSKITGAMGKGLAVLTFDDEYQKKRRQALSRRPTTFHEGMARSGKGLVMGFVDGVSGVVMKPITGAKEEGFGGFVKGLGKGTIGLLARPTAGIVDFAHGTFESVKRVAEMNIDVKRLRPPRFLSEDGVLRPYKLNDAKGFQLLKDLEKGKFATTDSFVYYDEIAEKNEYVLVTNYRIIYASRNETFGSYTLVWSYLFNEIVRLVSSETGVEINMRREKKKLFAPMNACKTIALNTPLKREKLVQAIELQISNL